MLRVEERRPPRPGRGQVRIRVSRAGVAYGDVMRRRGVLAPPWSFTPGYDVVGQIDALGAGTAGAIGDRVAVMMPGPGFGGYADHVLASASRLVPVPDAVDDDTALALGLNYITARQLLERLVPLEPGRSILIHGAGGGVGTALLDLGRLRGLRLYGTASAGKHDHVRARGGVPIDYRSEDEVARIAALTGHGVDAVFDGIGGEHLVGSYACLAPGGSLVFFGISGDIGHGPWRLLKGLWTFVRLRLRRDSRQVLLYNIMSSRETSADRCREDWAANLALAAEGALTPHVGAILPLPEVSEAHRLMDEAKTLGKVVLDCR